MIAEMNLKRFLIRPQDGVENTLKYLIFDSFCYKISQKILMLSILFAGSKIHFKNPIKFSIRLEF